MGQVKRICEVCGRPVEVVRRTSVLGSTVWSGYVHTGDTAHDPVPVWVDGDWQQTGD